MKIALFLLFKVLEIGGFIFIPYWIGLLWHKIPGFCDCESKNKWCVWLSGLACTSAALLVAGMLCVGAYKIILLNWEWVNKIL